MEEIERLKIEHKNLAKKKLDLERNTNKLTDKRHKIEKKEIEEKERDLEFSVCFDICARPIFMCHLLHQICKQCRPKDKVFRNVGSLTENRCKDTQ